MKKSVLVTLADKNYVEQAKQLFSSAYHNAGWSGDYCLLSYKIPEKELRWFKERGIYVKECGEEIEKKCSGKQKMPSRYFCSNGKESGKKTFLMMSKKFLVFTPEFKKWDIVVFLDSDIIVKKSLERLKKTKNFLAAPRNIFMSKGRKIENLFLKGTKKDREIFEQIKKENNVSKKAFNAGVFAFNTRIIRKNTFENLKNLFKKYSKISYYGDEPIMNLYFSKKWEELPIGYNLCINIFGKRFEKTSPIIHFAGLNKEGKPWKDVNPHYYEWLENLRKAEHTDFRIHKKIRTKSPYVLLLFQSFYLNFINPFEKKFSEIIRKLDKNPKRIF